MTNNPVEPDVVLTDVEFVKFGLIGNFLSNFCDAISCSSIPTKEKVCVPDPGCNASNSIKSFIGINDLERYSLIWFVFDKTSTKYEPSGKFGKTVPCAV